MQALSPEQRASAVNTLADLLVSREEYILQANAKDLAEAQRNGLAKPLLSRLSLNAAKLRNLSVGLKQIADASHKVSIACFSFNFFIFRFPLSFGFVWPGTFLTRKSECVNALKFFQ